MKQRVSLQESHPVLVVDGEVVEGDMPPRPRRNTLGAHQSPPPHLACSLPRTLPRKHSTSYNEGRSPTALSPPLSHFSFSTHTLSSLTSHPKQVHWASTHCQSLLNIPQSPSSSTESPHANIFVSPSIHSVRGSTVSLNPSSLALLEEKRIHLTPVLHRSISSASAAEPTLFPSSFPMAATLGPSLPPSYHHLHHFPRSTAVMDNPGHPKTEFTFNPYAPTVTMHFLMPNGVLIIIPDVSPGSSLAEIKADLWDKARDYPLYGLLSDQTEYHFVTSGTTGLTNAVVSASGGFELLEEDITLREVSPVVNFLKVIERKGDEQEKFLEKDISNLIGKNISEFFALKNPEVNEFRGKMRTLCSDVMKARASRSWVERVKYKYPCSISPEMSLPLYLAKRCRENGNDQQILVSVRFAFAVRSVKSMFTLRVENKILPNSLMEMALNKFTPLEASRQTHQTFKKCDYIFKTSGREEYLVEEVPLFRYMSVQEYLGTRDQHPLSLMVVGRNSLNVSEEEKPMSGSLDSTRNSFSTMTLSKKKSLNVVSSWTVTDDYRIELGVISKLNLIGQGSTMVRVVGGLYHGTFPLCEKQQTELLNVIDDKAEINQSMIFEIAVCEIPRSARLCLAILEEAAPTQQQQKGSKKGGAAGLPEYPRGVAWVNISVFDYWRGLRRGAITLYCWPVDLNQNVDLPRPLGTVVSNPDHHTARAFTVTFHRYHPSHEVMYPSKDTLLERARQEQRMLVNPTKDDLETIEKVASTPTALRDPKLDICEQDRKRLWSLRWYCANEYRHLKGAERDQADKKCILPRLLECVDFDKRLQVSEVTELLEEWPKLHPTHALELLDYNFAEPIVRDYAVDCITQFSDEDLLLYLLQLTQALKHENHLHCSLAEFLLQRALNNTQIGHYLFWHLRSEMADSSVSIRFGLLLEAYCKGAPEHMKLLAKQLDALNAFRVLKKPSTSLPKLKSVRGRETHLDLIIQTANLESALNNFNNLLDPKRRLTSIRTDKCRLMDSKMAPLWLVFETDTDDDYVSLLFKAGDDLRQDMLTLQTIRIMDKLWKQKGLDLRMNPYGCMSTNHREGLIEGVRNATTIANIQRDKGMLAVTCPFRKGSLLDWLREKNPAESSLNKAVSEFTLSCAGYCVATYVLGIADRHSDNIMIMENGQLFHIDFGHILGNFKEKFGFKRERQPFVLTHDFIYVITKGNTGILEKSDEFENFKKNCEQAYMILRENGSFIISLFAMMISTGLPELQEEKDLDYISDKLQLGLNDDEAALKHFRKEFREAMKNSWTTSLNWVFHAMSKDNR